MMTYPKPLRAAPACLLLAPILAGCGGGAPAPEAVSAKIEDSSSLEGAAAAVDRAEHTLDDLLPRQSSTIGQQAGAGGFATPPPAAAPPPPPPPPPAVSAAPVAPPAEPVVRRELQHNVGAAKKSAPAGAPTTGSGPATALDACSTACSALASMARAADHLCSLAGTADARCTSARSRVTSATARVHASCPACGG